MNKMYITSQIVAFVAFILSLIAYHRKEKKKIFQTMMIGNILDIIHYFLLGAYSGCITKVMALIRNEIIILKEKKNQKKKKIDVIIIIIAYIVSGILTYKNIYSILPIMAAIIYLVFVWNGNELQVKIAAFGCYFLWLTYNICVLSVVGILSNCVAIISTFFAMKNERHKSNMENYI